MIKITLSEDEKSQDYYLECFSLNNQYFLKFYIQENNLNPILEIDVKYQLSHLLPSTSCILITTSEFNYSLTFPSINSAETVFKFLKTNSLIQQDNDLLNNLHNKNLENWPYPLEE